MQSSPRIDELRQKFHENPRRYFAPLANEYRKAGDPEQAIAICRAHLAQQPGHMSGHVVYGQALYDAERIDEARVVFQQALALDPENLIVLRHLGDIARRQGDVEEARNWYSRALDGDPQDAEVAAYLAELTEPLVVLPSTEAAASPYADVTSSAEASDESQLPDDSPYLDAASATSAAAEVAPVAETEPSESSAEDALEAEVAAADMEAEGAPSPAPVDAEPARGERGFRSTPAFESTPIVTRTLAELYLQQGYIEPALEIYRQLAEREPEDAAIRARITELSGVEAGEQDRESGESSVPPASTAETTPVTESAPPATGEVSDKQPSSELWDTADSWSTAMFDESEDTDEIFGISAMGDAPMAAAATGGGEPEAPSWDSLHSGAPAAETGAPEAHTPPAPGAKTPAAEVPPEEKPEGHPARPAAEPRGITIREFFATLGARRPPASGAGDDSNLVTSPDVSPSEAGPPSATSSEDENSYQYADDAFANLFGNAPVNPEDSRAAAALSGAVAHTTPAVTVAASTESGPGRDAGATRVGAQPVQESEEDIRRFREWLEGLANS